MKKKLPTLVSLLKGIVPQPAQKRPLLGFLISQLLKSRHQRLGRGDKPLYTVIHIIYTYKLHYRYNYMNLQPLNVYQGTLDIEVQVN